MTWRVKVELTDGRGAGADWLQVTRPTLQEALAAVRGIVMPGVLVTAIEAEEEERT